MADWQVITGDCLNVMKGMDANSVDTIITDPPAAIAFMGKSWDSDRGGRAQWVAWLTEVMAEGLRVLKPGGMALVWALPRTSHWTALAVEDAGFEIREKIYHLFGSGFPKSHQFHKSMNGSGADWQGYGTALKPAAEEWIVAMKPLDGTFAHNAQKWGVGGLNIDGCRVGTDLVGWGGAGRNGNSATAGASRGGQQGGYNYANGEARPASGRWPANVIHDGSDEVLAGFPVTSSHGGGQSSFGGMFGNGKPAAQTFPDTGSAARYFYCAKASRAERNAGLEGMEARPIRPEGREWGSHDIFNTPGNGRNTDNTPAANHHPTVKPLALMRYLCRLTKTPTGGIVLDPFAGSGSTGCAAVMEGRRFIGIELSDEYAEIARARIAKAAEQAQQMALALDGEGGDPGAE